MIGLVLAAALQAQTPACYSIDSQELARRSAEVRSAEFIEVNAQFEKTVRLLRYWADACPKDRKNLSREDVVELSSLLQLQHTRHHVPRMLVEVGKNLRYASADVDQALKDVEAQDEAAAKLSPLAFGAPSSAYLLRCLQNKIRTGRKDRRLCWTLRTIRPSSEIDKDAGGPVTLEAKEIKRD